MNVDIIDSAHVIGCEIIKWIQGHFHSLSLLWQFVTELGSPGSSLHIAFPLAFYCGGRALAYRVIWTMVITEWLNGVFKWFLHGHRPYWWYQENSMFFSQKFYLLQFPSTCEIGPGSPSGHCMVTSATWFVLLLHYLNSLEPDKEDQESNSTDAEQRPSPNPKKTFMQRSLAFLSFSIFLTAVAISRCFIATHFPHQVVAGIIAGVFLAVIIARMKLENSSALFCAIVGIALFAVVFFLRQLLVWMHIDPEWSVKLAQRYCARSEWIHLSTSLLFAFSRDSAVLFGTALTILLDKRCTKLIPMRSRDFKWAALVLSSIGAYFLKNYSLLGKQTAPYVFYSVTILKITVIPFYVMRVVPWLLNNIM